MKLIIKFSLATLFVAGLVLSSCSKKDDVTTTTATKSKEDYLTTGSWIATAITIDPGIPTGTGTTITDFYAQQDACSKDDFRTFRSDGKYIDDEGKDVCPGGVQTEQGTYLWNSDKTIITETDANGRSNSYNVIQLDANTFKATKVEKINGVNYTLTITSQHK